MTSAQDTTVGPLPVSRRRSPHKGDPAVPFALERGLWAQGHRYLAGVDEVGRGPLAGPVVAAAVILPPGTMIEGADDSKRLTPARRERISELIERRALAIGIGAASVREVDSLNILKATHLAMYRAVCRLRIMPDHLIVDGLPVPILGEAQTAVVGGDRLVHTVACASIVAKVTRDRIMRNLGARYPLYRWESNVGYGTSAHLEALARHGPTPHHRRSFAPVQLSLGI